MALDERALFTEKQETRQGRYQCPKCQRTAEYSIRWARRMKKDRLPPGADDADRAKFAQSPDRKWSVLVAFHPAARGRAMVEKYAAAAEQYGYIVAGSNNSRNGPWSASVAAVQAVPADLGRRFSIDPRRVYLTGMSGGARVALQVALAKNDIAGVIASSAGYPDSRPRGRVPFALFSTAGTEDFN